MVDDLFDLIQVNINYLPNLVRWMVDNLPDLVCLRVEDDMVDKRRVWIEEDGVVTKQYIHYH